MSSTVWTAPGMRLQEANVLRFLKDAQCSVRLVDVSLFKEFIFDRVSTRRWEPDGNLARAAKEISKYVADGESVEVLIVASDEL
jgi:hypothetical protein